MKKKKIYIAIAACFVISSIILINDYYRPTFVDNKENPYESDDSIDQSEGSAPVINEALNEEVKIGIFGDNLVHENVLNYANLLAGGSGNRDGYAAGFDFMPMFEMISERVSEVDYAICNQASLVGANDSLEKLSGYPLFNSPSKLADDLIEIGFDGVNISNNHMLDMTLRGYQKSVSFWKEKNIDLIGGYSDEEEKNNIEQKIHRIGDFDVGILSYTETTNGLSSEKTESIPYFTLNESAILQKMLQEQVASCREKCDIVVVLINWGNSESYEPGEIQRKTAKILCNAGADVIIGTGPKVIQNVEELVSENGEHHCICAYSLGNMMCTMEYMENLLGGYVTFDIKRVDGEAQIANFVFHPTVIHYDENISNIAVFPLKDYSEDKYYEHGSNVRKGAGNFSWFERTVEKCIPTEYR